MHDLPRSDADVGARRRPGSRAWTWPADGAVLREFSVGTDKYAGGQHRGIDVALGDAPSARAPASGEVTFAGSLPTYGATVTIATAGGHRATLTHLGDLRVRRGEQVSEGQPLADAGTSGEPEHAVPYVHLGIRLGSDEDYVDPSKPASIAGRRRPSTGTRGTARAPSAPVAGRSRRPIGRERLRSLGTDCAATDVGWGPGRERSASRARGRVVRTSRIDDDGVETRPRVGRGRGARPTPFGRRAAHDAAWGALGSRRDVTRTRRRTRVPTPASRLARRSAARDSPSRDLVARPIRPSASRRAPIRRCPRHQGAASAQQLRRAATLHSPTPQAAARRGTHVLDRWWILALDRGVHRCCDRRRRHREGAPRRWGGQRATPYHSRP